MYKQPRFFFRFFGRGFAGNMPEYFSKRWYDKKLRDIIVSVIMEIHLHKEKSKNGHGRPHTLFVFESGILL